MQKIITIDGRRVVIDVNILSIKEFRDLYENLEEETSIKLFTWLHFMYDVESPYANVKDEERESLINKEFPGLDIPKLKRNHLFILAEDKMKTLSETPVSRFLNSLKVSLDKMSDLLVNEDIVSGKDGNLSEVIKLHQQAKALITNYNAVEAEFKKEVSKNRGNTRTAVDEGDSSDDFA